MNVDHPNTPLATQQDEIIAETRANREAYAAQFGYDVHAILRRSRERAAQSEAETRRPRGISKQTA